MMIVPKAEVTVVMFYGEDEEHIGQREVRVLPRVGEYVRIHAVTHKVLCVIHEMDLLGMHILTLGPAVRL